jgi:hypothetical protein
MPSFYNAGQMYTLISSICVNEMEDLSTDEQGKKDAVYRLMNICLWKMPRVVYWSQNSDLLNISADGYVTFKYGGSDITDMFEPQAIYRPDGQPLTKRQSDDAPIGWFRESQNMAIHIKGFPTLTSGNYKLKYLRYPKQITIDSDPVEIAPSGYYELIFDVCKLIKLTRNSYGGADYMGQQADKALMQAVQAGVSAKGPISGPSDRDVSTVRGI